MKPWTSESERNPKDTNLIFQKTTPRVFNIIDVILIGVGSSLAVGSSVLIGEITKCVAGPAVVVSIFLAGVTALLGGLCLAEFGVQFHKVDSAYSYSYCWGKSTEAFIFGWALILQHIAGTASVAKGILSFTDALTDNKISDLLKNSTATPFPNVFPYFDYFSMAIILLITIFISIGLKDSIIIKKLFTICSTVLFIGVIIAGALRADVKNWEKKENSDSKNGFAPFGGLGVVKAAAVAVYGFIGFDSFSCTGNELNKPKINLPLAILATAFITLVIFSGIGVVLTLMLPYTELSTYAAVPFAFQYVELSAMKWVAVVATFFAFQTSFFGVVFPLPRIIHAMANDGLLFHWLGNNHLRFNTPVLAIVAGGLLASVVAGIFTFKAVVNVAVIAALFVYTILALNVIILRYFPRFEDNKKEFWKSLVCNNNTDVSLKAVMQNSFNFKEKQPTNLTKTIIMGNLVLFCICSIGLGIIFNFFYDFLARCAVEAAVPASILVCVMFFNIISMCCQPKSQETVPFKVPLFPFIPCFSIFLNILLMMTFDSITWILFSSWMIVGALSFFTWHFWKLRKGELGKISLYEINSTNTMKLTKTIWKIKSDKKSFYEGAVNPVFTYDFDDNPDEKDANVEVRKQQLKQDEIIQRAESVVEKKPEQLNHELQLNFIPEDIDDNLGDESEKVHWECVAEIHTEEEFSPESVALEIVDNTYNFLSEESEEMFKDDVNGELKEKPIDNKSSESLELTETNHENPVSKNKISEEKLLNDTKTGVNSSNKQKELINNSNFEKTSPTVLQENNNSLFFKSPDSDHLPFCDKNDEKLVYLIVETFYEAHQSEMISQQNNATDAKPVLDEQNKIKDFKEKLNQLLKNQINNAVVLTKDSSLSKPDDSNNSEVNKDVIHNSFKTLNKSQIKDKLELLLAKKPSQRPSLKSSFNINLKETENESAPQKTNEETPNILNGSEKEEISTKLPPVSVNSIKEKILSLKNVDSESSDICC